MLRVQVQALEQDDDVAPPRRGKAPELGFGEVSRTWSQGGLSRQDSSQRRRRSTAGGGDMGFASPSGREATPDRQQRREGQLDDAGSAAATPRSRRQSLSGAGGEGARAAPSSSRRGSLSGGAAEVEGGSRLRRSSLSGAADAETPRARRGSLSGAAAEGRRSSLSGAAEGDEPRPTSRVKRLPVVRESSTSQGGLLEEASALESEGAGPRELSKQESAAAAGARGAVRASPSSRQRSRASSRKSSRAGVAIEEDEEEEDPLGPGKSTGPFSFLGQVRRSVSKCLARIRPGAGSEDLASLVDWPHCVQVLADAFVEEQKLKQAAAKVEDEALAPLFGNARLRWLQVRYALSTGRATPATVGRWPSRAANVCLCLLWTWAPAGRRRGRRWRSRCTTKRPSRSAPCWSTTGARTAPTRAPGGKCTRSRA